MSQLRDAQRRGLTYLRLWYRFDNSLLLVSQLDFLSSLSCRQCEGFLDYRQLSWIGGQFAKFVKVHIFTFTCTHYNVHYNAGYNMHPLQCAHTHNVHTLTCTLQFPVHCPVSIPYQHHFDGELCTMQESYGSGPKPIVIAVSGGFMVGTHCTIG